MIQFYIVSALGLVERLWSTERRGISPPFLYAMFCRNSIRIAVIIPFLKSLLIRLVNLSIFRKVEVYSKSRFGLGVL